LAELIAQVQPLIGRKKYHLFAADARVLAQDLVSPLQVPPQDNSSMDGYAVRCADLAAGLALPVSQRIAAGACGSALAASSVARIFTGAPIPDGADAVVPQEDCTLQDDGQVRSPARCRWVPGSGAVARTSPRVVLFSRKGRVLRLPSWAWRPALVPVSCRWRRPRVALFSTGDELVMPGDVAPHDMPPGAIYNSNRFFLRALLQRLGCEVSDLGIVPDQREATVAALQAAAQEHDLILTSGGVSVGEEDHIKPAVQALGHLDLWQIAIKPGKPFAYGRVGAAHFMGLPGNPVSSFVTFLLLVRPFLLRLQGVTRWAAPSVTAQATFSWPKADKRREFLRARRNADGSLALFPNQSSGVLTSVVWGDGLVDNPPGQTIQPGDTVRFVALAELLS
jgi:molybdopterin molybdotransferase